MSLDRPIRVGLIGVRADAVSSWAGRAHIPALRHLPQFELLGLCTSRRDSAEAVRRFFDVPLAFHDPERMAEHDDIDFIVVCVRSALRFGAVEAAIAAGKAILCEWPLGVDTAQATILRDSAAAAAIPNFIGLQAGANETLRYVRDLIKDGFVGRVTSLFFQDSESAFGPTLTPHESYLTDENTNALVRIALAHALEAIGICVGLPRKIVSMGSIQFPEARIAGSNATVKNNSIDHVVVGAELEGGAIACLCLKGGATRTAGVRLEINGEEGDLLITSDRPGNIQRATLTVRGGRAMAMEVMPLPQKYRLAPPGLPEGPALSVAHNYVAIAARLMGGVSYTPDFTHAVRRHQLIDAIESDMGRHGLLFDK